MNQFSVKEIMDAIAYLGEGASQEEIEFQCLESRDERDYERERDTDVRDTPMLANCDDAGTGEGRWHGRM